jgi:hypothetical protein
MKDLIVPRLVSFTRQMVGFKQLCILLLAHHLLFQTICLSDVKITLHGFFANLSISLVSFSSAISLQKHHLNIRSMNGRRA